MSVMNPTTPEKTAMPMTYILASLFRVLRMGVSVMGWSRLQGVEGVSEE